jgi:crossover junction endodeoxyribonuclease RuvC
MGVTAQQFEQMQARLRGGRRVAAPVSESATMAPTTGGVILGIDPSLRSTGYGAIRAERASPRVLVHGAITCPAGWERSRCLVQIAVSLREVIAQHQPGLCVVESLFYAQNLQTALIMGEARGVCLATAAEAGLDIYEIAPRKVKQAVVGYGGAQKLAVAKMVQRMLRLAEAPGPDAADALALALTFAQETNRFSLTPRKRI